VKPQEVNADAVGWLLKNLDVHMFFLFCALIFQQDPEKIALDHPRF
jgi:hypothetical protein